VYNRDQKLRGQGRPGRFGNHQTRKWKENENSNPFEAWKANKIQRLSRMGPSVSGT
jgi:hypothetical protein